MTSRSSNQHAQKIATEENNTLENDQNHERTQVFENSNRRKILNFNETEGQTTLSMPNKEMIEIS